MIFTSPLSILISNFGGTLLICCVKGTKGAAASLKILAVTVVGFALFNAAFNHYGVTTLFYAFDLPITFEALAYGMAAGGMFSSVIIWFMSLNEILTDDKILYIFGKKLPHFSLIMTMALRFVPHYRIKLKQIISARKGLGLDMSQATLGERLRTGSVIMNTLIGTALDDSFETAESMESRGYGTAKRSSYLYYKMDIISTIILIVILLAALFVIILGANSADYVSYNPRIVINTNYFFASIYLLLAIFPFILELICELKLRKSLNKAKFREVSYEKQTRFCQPEGVDLGNICGTNNRYGGNDS